MDPILGQIRLFAFGYAPKGWLLCDGATLNISEHTAVFSLLGATYGGNGSSTFALPHLTGKEPICGERLLHLHGWRVPVKAIADPVTD